MGRSKKFDYQAVILASLSARTDGLTLDELLERSGFQVDRSTLFRHLARLIQSGAVERVGKARASRYLLLDAGAANQARAPLEARDGAQEAPKPQPAAAPTTHSAASIPQPAAKSAAGPGENHAGPTPAAESGSHAAAEFDPVVIKAVRKIVREWKQCSRMNLEIYLSLLVRPEQVGKVAAVVEKELLALKEDNLHRFELTPEEFQSFTPPNLTQAAEN